MLSLHISGIEDENLVMSCVQKRPEISNGMIPKTLDIWSAKTSNMLHVDYEQMAKLAPIAGDTMIPLHGQCLLTSPSPPPPLPLSQSPVFPLSFST